MGNLEKKVLMVLKVHKGRDNPITAKKISERTGIPEREVRRAISGLVTRHKVLIASSVQRPFGFYLINNLDELKECLGQYHSRLKNLKDRTQSLYKAGLKKFSKEIQDEFKFD